MRQQIVGTGLIEHPCGALPTGVRGHNICFIELLGHVTPFSISEWVSFFEHVLDARLGMLAAGETFL